MNARTTAVTLFAVLALGAMVGCGDSPDPGLPLPKGNPTPKQTFGLVTNPGPANEGVAADDGQLELGSPTATGQQNSHPITRPQLQ
jgi:hypothetical protein